MALIEIVGGGGPVTVTVVDAWLVPPAPVQLSVKVVLTVRLPVLAVPLVACAPLQPPEAVQPVALVLDQLICAALPVVTEVGVVLMVTVGVGSGGGGLPPPPPPPQATSNAAANGTESHARSVVQAVIAAIFVVSWVGYNAPASAGVVQW